MSGKKSFNNIIDGEVQASADGAMMDIVNPSTGEATRARRTPRPSTPSERQRAAKARGRDTGERRGTRRLRVENTGKPPHLAMSEEIPPMVDQIRVFAGAARVLETLIADLRQDDELVQREVFGPVVAAQRFSDEDEAIRFANGASTGWHRQFVISNAGRAARWRRGWTSAACRSTPTFPSSPRCPTEGSGTPSIGKDLSMYGFEDYIRIKHVMQYHGFKG
jgi:acyl-CoA reductase-like NAD-dependent aldehyde dehydrogenase